jgi:mycobactin lysine-N-oxygenase
MAIDSDLLVVGAGAKGIAIAAKAHVLNSVGLGPISVILVEAVDPACAWLDGNGVTSSREVLAISPAKDVAFPYHSTAAFGEAGAAVDEAALELSWQRYLVEQGDYARWIDAGSPPVQRRVYGAYLKWVLTRARDGVTLVRGRVARAEISAEGTRWAIGIESTCGPCRCSCDALALTGPGEHRSLPHDRDALPRLLDCDRGRSAIGEATVGERPDVAIVGGGESALSCVEFVRALRPESRLTIYTPGLPASRLESFLENRVFSDPDSVAWAAFSLAERREFIARTDRGVFGPERVAALAYDERCTFVPGRVLHVGSVENGAAVSVRHETRDGARNARHDYVINCTGFDLLAQLRSLLSHDARTEIERQVGTVWGREQAVELAWGPGLELAGLRPRLQVPGLAGVSQGPGFANLGSLGLLADRVLAPLLAGGYAAEGAAARRHDSREAMPAGVRRATVTSPC